MTLILRDIVSSLPLAFTYMSGVERLIQAEDAEKSGAAEVTNKDLRPDQMRKKATTKQPAK